MEKERGKLPVRILWNSQNVLLSRCKISALIAGSDSTSAALKFPQDILHFPNKQLKTAATATATATKSVHVALTAPWKRECRLVVSHITHEQSGQKSRKNVHITSLDKTANLSGIQGY